ncbi:hypothetical protein ACWA2C_28040 [Priestia megaterium]
MTPKIKKTIIEAVERGNYVETAAALAGVSRSTLYDWMRRGAREADRLDKFPDEEVDPKEKPFLDFSDTLTRAMAVAEDKDIQNINKAAEEDWKASAWRLQRKHPDRWGQKETVDANLQHSGKDGGPIETKSTFDLSKLSDEELALLGSIIAKNSSTEDS